MLILLAGGDNGVSDGYTNKQTVLVVEVLKQIQI